MGKRNKQPKQLPKNVNRSKLHLYYITLRNINWC